MQNKKGENNKNLPALIPVLTLTEEQFNIVDYSIKNILKEIYCEGVTVINGWVTMTNLRVKKCAMPEFKLVRAVGFNVGRNSDGDWCHGWNDNNVYVYLCEEPNIKSFSVEGYDTLAARTLPQKDIEGIDSFNYLQQEQLPLWARIPRKGSIEQANKNVEEFNDKTLKSNAMKFSLMVQGTYEWYLTSLYKQIPKWKRSLFSIDQKEWENERRKQPDMQEKMDDFIEDMKIAFNKRDVEYDGDELHYDAVLGKELYNCFGDEIGSHCVYEPDSK